MSLLDKIRVLRGGRRIEVPTVLQMEAAECGAAALDMVLAYYGLWVPLEEMRETCGVNRDGSKASNIVKAAMKKGCTARGCRWTAKKLKEKEYPLIIHWEFNHFVVLEGFDDRYAYINDPAAGHRKVPFEQFRTSYTGIALEFIEYPSYEHGGIHSRMLEYERYHRSRGRLAVSA